MPALEFVLAFPLDEPAETHRLLRAAVHDVGGTVADSVSSHGSTVAVLAPPRLPANAACHGAVIDAIRRGVRVLSGIDFLDKVRQRAAAAAGSTATAPALLDLGDVAETTPEGVDAFCQQPGVRAAVLGYLVDVIGDRSLEDAFPLLERAGERLEHLIGSNLEELGIAALQSAPSRDMRECVEQMLVATPTWIDPYDETTAADSRQPRVSSTAHETSDDDDDDAGYGSSSEKGAPVAPPAFPLDPSVDPNSPGYSVVRYAFAGETCVELHAARVSHRNNNNNNNNSAGAAAATVWEKPYRLLETTSGVEGGESRASFFESELAALLAFDQRAPDWRQQQAAGWRPHHHGASLGSIALREMMMASSGPPDRRIVGDGGGHPPLDATLHRLVRQWFGDAWAHATTRLPQASQAAVVDALTRGVTPSDLAAAEGAVAAIGACMPRLLAQLEQGGSERDAVPNIVSAFNDEVSQLLSAVAKRLRLAQEDLASVCSIPSSSSSSSPPSTAASMMATLQVGVERLEDVLAVLKVASEGREECYGASVFGLPPEHQYRTLGSSLRVVSSSGSATNSGGAPLPTRLASILSTGLATRGGMDGRFRLRSVIEVRSPDVDARHFDGEARRTGNCQLLVHGTRAGLVVPILRGGLQVPPSYRTRRDRGMLGRGIYFGDSLATALKYAEGTASVDDGEGGDGGRHHRCCYIFVSEVALGRVWETDQHVYDLTAAPADFDSVRGRRSTPGAPTDFTEDEYVVYSEKQQTLRYVLEIAIDPDPEEEGSAAATSASAVVVVSPPPPPTVVYPASSMDPSALPQPLDLAGLEQRAATKQHGDEGTNSSSAAGLTLVAGSSDDADAPMLKRTILKATVIDTIGEVTLLQTYATTSPTAVEARYTFPLQTGAAVCGFEAYINDKHVVGVVKPKQEAHREYKAAVAAGHGAYLMDAEEDAPDVFTVSVGNLPPGASVVIKITYLIELKIDVTSNSIEFVVPATVHPVARDAAARRTLQSTTGTLLADATTTASSSRSTLSVEVALDMPFDIIAVEASHPTDNIQRKRSATRATLVAPDVDLAAHGDLRFRVQLAVMARPRLWVEDSHARGTRAAMFTACLPSPMHQGGDDTLISKTQQDVVLMLDASCSMRDGNAARDAMSAALFLLAEIPPTWAVNVCIFGSHDAWCFGRGRGADMEAKQECANFLRECYRPDLSGTQLLPLLDRLAASKAPVSAALARRGDTSCTTASWDWESRRTSHRSLISTVFLISDGACTSSDELRLAGLTGPATLLRVFPVAVGASPSVSFVHALARNARGVATVLPPSARSSWAARLRQHVQHAANPALADVHLHWSTEHNARVRRQLDANVTQSPAAPASVIPGEAAVFYGVVDSQRQQLRQCELLAHDVNGADGTPSLDAYGEWRETRYLATVAGTGFRTGDVIHKLAAHARIRDWTDGTLVHRTDAIRPQALVTAKDVEAARAALVPQITSLGCEFGLVTPFTSMIAVEVRDSDEQQSLKSQRKVHSTPDAVELAKGIVADLLPEVSFNEDSGEWHTLRDRPNDSASPSSPSSWDEAGGNGDYSSLASPSDSSDEKAAVAPRVLTVCGRSVLDAGRAVMDMPATTSTTSTRLLPLPSKPSHRPPLPRPSADHYGSATTTAVMRDILGTGAGERKGGRSAGGGRRLARRTTTPLLAGEVLNERLNTRRSAMDALLARQRHQVSDALTVVRQSSAGLPAGTTKSKPTTQTTDDVTHLPTPQLRPPPASPGMAMAITYPPKPHRPPPAPPTTDDASDVVAYALELHDMFDGLDALADRAQHSSHGASDAARDECLQRYDVLLKSTMKTAHHFRVELRSSSSPELESQWQDYQRYIDWYREVRTLHRKHTSSTSGDAAASSAGGFSSSKDSARATAGRIAMRQEQTLMALQRTERVLEETEEIGSEAARTLARQTEQISSTNAALDRLAATEEVEREMRDLKAMYQDFSALVADQSQSLDAVESNVTRSASHVERGVTELSKASASSSRWNQRDVGGPSSSAGAPMAAEVYRAPELDIDHALDQITSGVEQLRATSVSIREELHEQSALLDTLDTELDTTGYAAGEHVTRRRHRAAAAAHHQPQYDIPPVDDDEDDAVMGGDAPAPASSSFFTTKEEAAKDAVVAPTTGIPRAGAAARSSRKTGAGPPPPPPPQSTTTTTTTTSGKAGYRRVAGKKGTTTTAAAAALSVEDRKPLSPPPPPEESDAPLSLKQHLHARSSSRRLRRLDAPTSSLAAAAGYVDDSIRESMMAAVSMSSAVASGEDRLDLVASTMDKRESLDLAARLAALADDDDDARRDLQPSTTLPFDLGLTAVALGAAAGANSVCLGREGQPLPITSTAVLDGALTTGGASGVSLRFVQVTVSGSDCEGTAPRVQWLVDVPLLGDDASGNDSGVTLNWSLDPLQNVQHQRRQSTHYAGTLLLKVTVLVGPRCVLQVERTVDLAALATCVVEAAAPCRRVLREASRTTAADCEDSPDGKEDEKKETFVIQRLPAAMEALRRFGEAGLILRISDGHVALEPTPAVLLAVSDAIRRAMRAVAVQPRVLSQASGGTTDFLVRFARPTLRDAAAVRWPLVRNSDPTLRAALSEGLGTLRVAAWGNAASEAYAKLRTALERRVSRLLKAAVLQAKQSSSPHQRAPIDERLAAVLRVVGVPCIGDLASTSSEDASIALVRRELQDDLRRLVSVVSRSSCGSAPSPAPLSAAASPHQLDELLLKACVALVVDPDAKPYHHHHVAAFLSKYSLLFDPVEGIATAVPARELAAVPAFAAALSDQDALDGDDDGVGGTTGFSVEAVYSDTSRHRQLLPSAVQMALERAAMGVRNEHDKLQSLALRL